MNAITDHLLKKTDVIQWMIDKISEIEDLTVKRFVGSNYNQLLNLLPSLQPNSAVISYQGTEYGEEPRAKLSFSVISITREWSDRSKAENEVMELIEEIISKLDHSIYNEQAFCYVTSDKWLELTNTGLIAYEINFTILDN